MTKITLCGRPKGCCPTVETVGDNVVITTDNKESVTLTREQWELLKKAEL